MMGGAAKIDCFLLTWHGTLLCAAPDTEGLVHRPLFGQDALGAGCRLTVMTQLDPSFADLVPLPDQELAYGPSTLGEGSAVRAASGRGYSFARDDQFLCAVQSASHVEWNRPRAGHWETFLPVPVTFLTRLVGLMGQSWIDSVTGETIAARELIFKPDFRFSVGSYDVDLTKIYPLLPSATIGSPDEASHNSFVITQGGRVSAFASLAGQSVPQRISLREAAHEPVNALGPAGATAEEAELDAEVLKAAETLYLTPLFAHRDDRAFFLNKAWNERPRLGFVTSKVTIRRARNCYAFLARTLEGVVFDAHGVYKDYGYITVSQSLPPSVTKEGDRYFLDVAAMNAAPALQGEYAMFYNGNLQNYYHWTAEAIVALFVLKKRRMGPTKIILPANIQSIAKMPYLESLKLLGFDDFEITFSSEPVVRLERCLWLNPGALGDEYPEHLLREFQATVSRSTGPLPAPGRLYVERAGLRGVANAGEVREHMERLGFTTIRLEGMSLLEQVRRFASAEFVVAPHGAGLSNLIFSPPSARVIEFMPDCEMRPFFWHISSKLGHAYGMLPCPTDNGMFNGNLRVDIDKFARLFALLEKA